MAHTKSKYAGLWKPQDLNVDKISSQMMFVDNINALEAFALSMLKRSELPVASLSDLRAIDTSDTTLYTDGMTIMVKSSGLYFFDRANTNADNGTTIIAPTTGGGRWVSDHTFLGSLAFKNSLAKSDIGLGNVPNVATNDQTPTFSQASTLTNIASGEKVSTLFGKIMKAIADLISHLANKSNPHGVTKTQIGLGNVDNTSDLDKPISRATQEALSLLSGGSADQLIEFTNHKNSTSNPHGVTKEQIGLGNVDNTPDASKPVSTAQATAIADAKKAGTDAQTNLGTHTSNTNNPHSVTKAQVGLGNVDNTADTNKPVSTAQATAIADAKKAGIDAQANLTSHTGNTSNPHGVTKTQVGLGNVPNVATNDQTPTYTQASTLANLTSGEKMSTLFGKIMKAIADLISHLANKSNPHGVTKAQVGLGSVDNTADASKPVSTAQATAIADAKKAGTDAQTSLGTHTGNTSNPHGVTKSQVGLSNVPNVATNDQTPTFSQASTLTNIASGEKVSTLFGKIMKAIADLISHLTNKSNPHGVTKSQVGLGNVDNTSDLNKPISTAVQAALNSKATVVDGEIATASYKRLTGFSLLENTDLNNIKYTGQYGVMASCSNKPAGTYGVMEVIMYSSHWIIQRYHIIDGDTGVITGTYYRTYYKGSTWTSWKLYNMNSTVAPASVE